MTVAVVARLLVLEAGRPLSLSAASAVESSRLSEIWVLSRALQLLSRPLKQSLPVEGVFAAGCWSPPPSFFSGGRPARPSDSPSCSSPPPAASRCCLRSSVKPACCLADLTSASYISGWCHAMKLWRSRVLLREVWRFSLLLSFSSVSPAESSEMMWLSGRLLPNIGPLTCWCHRGGRFERSRLRSVKFHFSVFVFFFLHVYIQM